MIKVNCLYYAKTTNSYVPIPKIIDPKNFEFDQVIGSEGILHYPVGAKSSADRINGQPHQDRTLWLAESLEEIWAMINNGSNNPSQNCTEDCCQSYDDDDSEKIPDLDKKIRFMEYELSQVKEELDSSVKEGFKLRNLLERSTHFFQSPLDKYGNSKDAQKRYAEYRKLLKEIQYALEGDE